MPIPILESSKLNDLRLRLLNCYVDRGTVIYDSPMRSRSNMRADQGFSVVPDNISDPSTSIIGVRVANEEYRRFAIQKDGAMWQGAGGATDMDVALYRSAESSHSQWNFRTKPSGGSLTDVARFYGTATESVLSLRNSSVALLDLKTLDDGANLTSNVIQLVRGSETVGRFSLTKDASMFWTGGVAVATGQPQTSQFGFYRALDTTHIVGLGTNQRVLSLFINTPSDSNNSLQDVAIIETSVSGGNGANNLGAGLLFGVEDNAGSGTILPVIRIAGVATTNTQAGITSVMDFYTRNAGGSLTKNMTLTALGQIQLPTQGLNGGLLLGGDTYIYRGGATDVYMANLRVYNNRIFIDGGTVPYLEISPSDRLTSGSTFLFYFRKFGQGNAMSGLTKSGVWWFKSITDESDVAPDTNLYAGAANRLRTDDAFNALLGIYINTILSNTMFSSEVDATGKSAAIFRAIASETADLAILQNSAGTDIIRLGEIHSRNSVQGLDVKLYRHTPATASANIRSPYINFTSAYWDGAASQDIITPLSGFATGSNSFGLAIRRSGTLDGVADPARFLFYTTDSSVIDIRARASSAAHVRLLLVDATDVATGKIYDILRNPGDSFTIDVLSSSAVYETTALSISTVGDITFPNIVNISNMLKVNYNTGAGALALQEYSVVPSALAGYVKVYADISGGKQRFKVRWADGVETIIATQP